MVRRGPLTALADRQREVMDIVMEYIDEHGYPPTIREIGEKMAIGSTNGVTCHLALIEKKGWVRRDRSLSRGIVVLRRPE